MSLPLSPTTTSSDSTKKIALVVGLTATISLAAVLLRRFCLAQDLEVFKRKDLAPVETRRTIEICLSDIESVRHAIKGGANSVELCADRPEGGTTPSIGFVELSVRLCRRSKVQVHVLIRPRAGDFVYSKEEFEVMKKDIIAVKQAGADGIVVGIHDSNGNIDKERMAIVRELASDMQLTFHRAFDLMRDYEAAVEDIVALGCDRLLTSGQERFAHQASGKKLRHIVELCRDRVHVVAGAGINADNVRSLILDSFVYGVHIGSSVNRNVLSDIAGLDTPLFAMAAEMKVWRCAHSDLIRVVSDKAREAWMELDMFYGRDR